ncbi:MAG: phosphatidylglycerol---prolipoprotein diacylglyceryl transferase, partial [Solirubrobacteraceae bacterium]|nr:phosphatidylglycerol---prolipoprotein diacylglyceryl transferase [Solirubrobacteraceae bacterium]
LLLAGTERFLVEFVRRNDAVLAGLTQAQLLSLAMMAAGAVWLWRARDLVRPAVLFAWYLLLSGTERFLVEFIRRNEPVVAGLTEAQLASLAMLLGGVAWLVRAARHGGLRAKPAAPTRAATARA